MPTETTVAPLLEMTVAERDVWDRHLQAQWRHGLFTNRDQHALAVAQVVDTMPRPSLFNRRRDEVARMVDTLLNLGLCWTADVIYPGVHKEPGWDHHRMVMVSQHTLYVGGQFSGERSFRLTDEQVQRFQEQGEAWETRRREHMAQTPTARSLHELVRAEQEASVLRREMGRRPRSRHGRPGSNDSDSWNTPSSPVPNAYNGFRGLGD